MKEMAVHKLDQLFKKKLGKHSSQPSVDAWAKMESMLAESKKKPVWVLYKVAAAILILITVGFVAYQFQFSNVEKENFAEIMPDKTIEKKQLASGDLKKIGVEKSIAESNSDKKEHELGTTLKENLPVKQNNMELAGIFHKEVIEESKDPKENVDYENVDYEIVIDDELLAINDSVMHEVPEAVKFINPEIDINQENKTAPKKERKPIRIIYKRGNNKQPQTLVAKNDTTNRKKVFNSIIDATKNITSGDLIASMRDAKDDFFSQGLDLNKSNRFKNKNSNK